MEPTLTVQLLRSWHWARAFRQKQQLSLQRRAYHLLPGLDDEGMSADAGLSLGLWLSSPPRVAHWSLWPSEVSCLIWSTVSQTQLYSRTWWGRWQQSAHTAKSGTADLGQKQAQSSPALALSQDTPQAGRALQLNDSTGFFADPIYEIALLFLNRKLAEFILGEEEKRKFWTIMKYQNTQIVLPSHPKYQNKMYLNSLIPQELQVGVEGRRKSKNIPEHRKRIHGLEIQASPCHLPAGRSSVMSLKPQYFHL